MEPEKIQNVAVALDELINADVSGRGAIQALYQAARKLTDRPLTLAAAELLCKKVKPGDPVFIATGFMDQPIVAPGCGESDGPPGAVVIAKALRLALKASPVLVVDETLIEPVKRMARAAGFQCVALEDLKYSVERNKLRTASVISLPVDPQAARQEALRLVDMMKPAACIAIERAGMNKAGQMHNMAGFAIGDPMAKVDYLFQVAREKGVATIGIGDGGNEIGMANIADDIVRAGIPCATQCQCPCGAGIVPATPVDVLMTANISNWGGYALAALLGAMTGVAEAVHTGELELAQLKTAADVGLHDPIAGSVEPSVDGCRAEVHAAMATMIRELVMRRWS
ncbi:MAG TPA: glutamate cyclase domain-containing protein [Patescibacteria group bacterium]|nr:glutamate cyclase domain-containing protein [Patescibacteria group bacterium]